MADESAERGDADTVRDAITVLNISYLFNPWSSEIFLKTIGSISIGNHHKLALAASFEYLCYGPTAIKNILGLEGSTLDVTIWLLQTSDSDV